MNYKERYEKYVDSGCKLQNAILNLKDSNERELLFELYLNMCKNNTLFFLEYDEEIKEYNKNVYEIIVELNKEIGGNKNEL